MNIENETPKRIYVQLDDGSNYCLGRKTRAQIFRIKNGASHSLQPEAETGRHDVNKIESTTNNAYARQETCVLVK